MFDTSQPFPHLNCTRLNAVRLKASPAASRYRSRIPSASHIIRSFTRTFDKTKQEIPLCFGYFSGPKHDPNTKFLSVSPREGWSQKERIPHNKVRTKNTRNWN